MKDSATNTVAESTAIAFGAPSDEVYEILSRNSADYAITTLAVTSQYEQDSFRDRIHIESLESVKHIVPWQTASA